MKVYFLDNLVSLTVDNNLGSSFIIHNYEQFKIIT
jgi:hypothetical protein